MKAVETDYQSGDSGRKSKKTCIIKAIGFQESVRFRANHVLLFLIETVERRQVEIRGGKIDVGIEWISVEDI